MDKYKNYTEQELISEYYHAKMRIRNPSINIYVKEKYAETIKIIEWILCINSEINFK